MPIGVYSCKKPFTRCLMAIGAIISLVLLALVVLFIATLIVLRIFGPIQAEKLMTGLPWMEWLTLDDVVALGHSKFWAKLLLPHFHRHGCLEIRQLENVTEEEAGLIEEFGFESFTVKCHE